MSARTNNTPFTERAEAEPDAALMSARVRHVVFDYLDRRAAGEPVTHQSMLADHPELLPDLALALKHVGIVNAACEEVAAGRASSFAVRCPNCHAATKVASDSSLVSVTCSSCGSTFSLIDDSSDQLPRSGAIGPFELTRWLGSGAFGEVYHARDSRLDRVVALKIPRRGRLGPQDSERFFREARAAAQLQHPNIVSLYEVGRADDTVYIVSEFIDGTSLAAWLGRQQRVTAREAAALCQKLAAALEHAHAAGVVHRDLKPANVLVDAAGEPHISDFGLARRDSGEVTMTLDGVLVGTPAYMSPEQARGDSHSADARSDIYSLGVILFELLTGELPFRGNVRRVTEQIVSEEVPSPRKLNATVPRDLETITLECLEKDPSRRYASAKDLADDLDRWRKGEPIHARPVNSAERLWRWCRRKPALAASLLSIFILFLIVIVGSPIALFRIDRERQTAIAARNDETELLRLADRRVYAADMKLAQRALDVNNIGGALSLLNRHRPANKSAVDLRGWEWRYLWSQCQSDAESVFCKTEKSVMSLSISHDGKWLATGYGGGVTIWDRQTRQEIERLGAGGHFARVAFSPTEPLLAYTDEPDFGSSSTDYSIRLWNVFTRKEVRTLPLSFHCYGLAFSADGQTLVTSTQNRHNVPAWSGAITVWRVADGTIAENYPVRQYGTGEGTPFALAGDGSIAAHMSADDKVRVIDLTTEHELWPPQKATDDYVKALALSPDAKILASGEGFTGSVIRLWDVASGQELGRLEGHRAGIHQLMFWPDGKTLASASLDQTIRVWDVSDPANGHQVNILKGHRGWVRALALWPDNTTLVSGSDDGTVCLWNKARTPKVRKYLTVPMPNTWGWRFTPDSQFLVTLYDEDDRTKPRVVRWSKESDFQEMEPLVDLGTDIVDEAWISGDCRWLATSYEDGEVRIWDLQTRRKTGEFNTGLKRAVPRAFIAEGKKLLLLDADNSLHEWDVTPGHEKETRAWPPAPGRYTGAFSSDGRRYLTSILNPDTKTGAVLTDLSTGRQTNLSVPAWYITASFSPDDRFFALGNWGGDARLFETATAKELTQLNGIFGQVHGVGFSPDSRRLVTGHGSGGVETVAVWDMDSYEKLLELEARGSLFDTVAFSPDGNVLAASNWRWLIHLWPAPSWEEIERIEAAESAAAQTQPQRP